MPEQPTLSDMIRHELDTGVTYAELEARSADPTTGQSRISDSQLNRLAKGTATRIPTEDQLRGIADALQLPYERVRQAAIAQWLPPEGERPADAAAQVRAEIAELRAEAERLAARAEELDRRAAAHPRRESA